MNCGCCICCGCCTDSVFLVVKVTDPYPCPTISFFAMILPDFEQMMYTFPFDPQNTLSSSKKIVTGA